jgi:N-acetylated-alpha-linked acidic dipeptidase
MSRVYGLEMIRMADADVLPYNYEDYGKEILVYLDAAKNKSKERFADKTPDFPGSSRGSASPEQAGAKMLRSNANFPRCGAPERNTARRRAAR